MKFCSKNVSPPGRIPALDPITCPFQCSCVIFSLHWRNLDQALCWTAGILYVIACNFNIMNSLIENKPVMMVVNIFQEFSGTFVAITLLFRNRKMCMRDNLWLPHQSHCTETSRSVTSRCLEQLHSLLHVISIWLSIDWSLYRLIILWHWSFVSGWGNNPNTIVFETHEDHRDENC